jgi:hypothetical protein
MEKMSDQLAGLYTKTTLLNSLKLNRNFIRYIKNLFKALILNFQKVFLLQTGTTDEKSYSGSAGVHSENLLKSLIEAYIVF